MSKQDREVQEVIKHAQYTASARGIRNMMELAKPDLAVTPDMFDRDPWLLNCHNGTLELQTGTLREHRLEDYITKLCPTEYDVNAVCPVWLSFLDSIFAGDTELITYLQRLCGYFLTGDTREQILPIAWGTGSNGKTTLINAVMEMMGADYAIKLDRKVVIAQDRDGHSTERMDLAGMRLGVVTETDDGQRFAEAMVKDLTGGERIRGRRVRENTWEYAPTHKLLLATNHKPRVKATDHAFWRRVKLTHFGVTIADEHQDKLLSAKLRAEHRGILAWAVRGCLVWQRDGLAEPECVRQATAHYRAAEDIIGQYIAERCIIGDDSSGFPVRAKSSDVYADYKHWCEANGLRHATKTKLTQALAERGIGQDTGRRWYDGIGLCAEANQ